jgi:hypothetical protein
MPAATAGHDGDGSIVHVRGADVWLTSPDGSSETRVTTDGGTPAPDGTGSSRYLVPSQTDDGSVIVAFRNQVEANGTRGYLWVMNRQGEVLSKFAPPQFEFVGSHTCPEFEQIPDGFVRAAVSPGGTRIAYEPNALFRDSACGLDSRTEVHVVGIDGSDHTVLKRASDGLPGRLQTASWASDTRLLLSSDEGTVYYADLPDDSAQSWYGLSVGSSLYPVLEAGRLATVGPSFMAPHIDLWFTSGPPTAPTHRCQYTGPSAASGRFYLPTWGPGGGALAWQEATGDSVNGEPGEGIWVVHVGDLTNATSCPHPSAASRIVPDGMEPFWGPAPVTPGGPATGMLRVTTSPPLPSQILVDGVPRDSFGLAWLKLPPGRYTVGFTAVEGFTTPAPATIDVTAGATTSVQGEFVRHGSLRVLTEPPLPATISVDGVPRNDWGMWTDLPAGSHEVCFGPVQGFTPPACQTVTLTPGALSTVTGTFAAAPAAPGPTGTGELRVTTSPALPSQILVDGTPRDTWGLTWLDLPPGTYTVSFRHVEGYDEPAPQEVTVAAGAVTEVIGAFVARGFLRVVTDPAVPATISVDGIPRNDWGMWTDLAVGTHELCFGPVPGFATPPCRTVTLAAGALSTVTETYPPA